MKRRTARRRTLAYLNGAASDDSDESDDDGDVPAQIPPSSIQDLVNPADAQQFDQTFSDADANLNIEGAFDPVAGPKQVIPRVAYVLNFNLLYNEQQERWEPQRSSDTGNSNGGIVSVAASRTVTVADGTFGELKTGITDPDAGGDVLVPAATVAQSSVAATAEIMQNDFGEAGTASNLLLNFDTKVGEYRVLINNTEGRQITYRIACLRVSI